jgi:hypothetical protein
MSRRFTKKRVLFTLGVATALALSATAIAYFTTTGSGSGNAQVGTNTAITLHATITPPAGGIVPGGPNSSVAFTADNPTGNGAQEVRTISLVNVKAYSDAGRTTDITGTSAGQCDTSHFSMADVTSNTDVPDGGSLYSLAGTGTLVFHDSSTNQDGCKSAYITANISSN